MFISLLHLSYFKLTHANISTEKVTTIIFASLFGNNNKKEAKKQQIKKVDIMLIDCIQSTETSNF